MMKAIMATAGAIATLITTSVVAQAAPIPSPQPFPKASAVKVNPQQKAQITQILQKTRSQIETVLTPAQREQVTTSLKNSKDKDTISIPKVSRNQAVQLRGVLQATSGKLITTLTPAQRRQILEQLQKMLLLE